MTELRLASERAGRSSVIAEGPADDGHGHDERKKADADNAESAAATEKSFARLRVHAAQSRHHKSSSPGKDRRQAGILIDGGKKIVGDLAGRKPRGNEGRDSGGQNERQNLASDPALDPGAGAAPDEVVPSEEGEGEGRPAVHGGFIVEPDPTVEYDARAAGSIREAREDEEAQQGVASDGDEDGEQSEELEPVLTVSLAASRADRLPRQKLEPATVAKHRS